MIKPTFVLNRATVVPPNFYHKCVSRILSTGGGHVWGACMVGGRGCAWWGVAGGACVPGKTAIAVGGTYSTEMHTCYKWL